MDATIDVKAAPYAFHSSIDKTYYDMCMPRSYSCLRVYIESVLRIDDPEIFHGMPVGLQLVGKTLEEEAVLAMTGIVVEALRSGRKARL